MSGEHRYHSAPASEEYRENFDRIFRGKRSGGLGYRMIPGTSLSQVVPIEDADPVLTAKIKAGKAAKVYARAFSGSLAE